jgi:OHCU decarboxylase
LNIQELNNLPKETAQSALLSCCGSNNWVKKMIAARPFANLSELLNQAKQVWQNLEAEDWREAFSAHPKIGEKKAVPHQSTLSAEWSKGEQSGAENAADAVKIELEEANRLYEKRFGFIFIVCATGKSAEEMLEICRARLSNETDAEIRIAADEQRKITEIRLKKLLYQVA